MVRKLITKYLQKFNMQIINVRRKGSEISSGHLVGGWGWVDVIFSDEGGFGSDPFDLSFLN